MPGRTPVIERCQKGKSPPERKMIPLEQEGISRAKAKKYAFCRGLTRRFPPYIVMALFLLRYGSMKGGVCSYGWSDNSKEWNCETLSSEQYIFDLRPSAGPDGAILGPLDRYRVVAVVMASTRDLRRGTDL